MSALNVLLAEDNAADAMIIEEMLKETGIDSSLTWLKDGEAVLDHFSRGNTADVIILDLNMPKMDGHTLIGRLRERDESRRIAIVVLTGSSSPADKERVRRSGIDSYLIKPMGIEEMDDVVRTLRTTLLGVKACRDGKRKDGTSEERT